MKKERVTKPVGCIAFGLSAVLLVFGEACWAGQGAPQSKTPPAKPSKEAAKPVTRQRRPITADPSTFTPNMGFGEAIDILRNSTRPRLNIAVLWKDLNENADIYRYTPIGMDGLSKVTLRIHLKFLLMSVSAGSMGELGYVVDEGVIIIATRESLPVRRKTRVYDVTDLVAPPANYSFMSMFGMRFGNGGYGAGRSYGAGGYGNYGGRTSVGTGIGSAPSIRGRSYGYNSGLTNLVRGLYGSGRSYRNNSRTRRSRQ